MNIIKKILLTFVATVLSLSIGTAAFASEAETHATDATETTEAADSKETVADKEEGIEENPFEAIFNTVSAYSSEIFSALAFISTLIVAYFYKKGMLPTLKKALSGISTALGAVGEKTEGTLAPIAEKTEELAEASLFMQGTLDGVVSSLGALEEKLDALKESEGERASFKTIMLSQVDMLYDIFMSSSLPQYKKDEIGEKIGAMREELKLCGEKTE